MNFEIVNVPDQLVAGIRQRGHYRDVGQVLPSLYEYATIKGAKFNGMPAFVMHEMSTEQAVEADKNGTALIEVVAPIAEKIEESSVVRCYTLDGGQMAKAVHKGPYDQCGPVYEALYKWIADNKKQVAGAAREVYLNDPHHVKPEDILTEIYVPVK